MIGPIEPIAWFRDRPVVVIGSGPSLKQQDVLDAFIFLPTIVVNDAYRFMPYADALYAADAQWWRWHRDVKDIHLPERKFTAQRESLTYRPLVNLVNVVRGYGISSDPAKIHSGGHSGHQAINLAVHLAGGRPSQIILLGFDMQPAQGTGRHHFFGEHPRPAGCKPYHINYADKIRHFETLAADLARLNIPIVNCSRSTAIPESWIPRRPLEEVMRDCATSASRPADDRTPDQPIASNPATPPAR